MTEKYLVVPSKLLGEIPRAFEQVFNIVFNMDTEVESDDEFSELPLDEKAVRFSSNMKTKIWAPWANALIVNVFQKDHGLPFLTFSYPKSLETNGEDGLRQLGQWFFPC